MYYINTIPSYLKNGGNKRKVCHKANKKKLLRNRIVHFGEGKWPTFQ